MGLIQPRNLRREIAKAGHKEAACNEYRHEKEKIVSSRFCHVSGRNAKSGQTDGLVLTRDAPRVHHAHGVFVVKPSISPLA